MIEEEATNLSQLKINVQERDPGSQTFNFSMGLGEPITGLKETPWKSRARKFKLVTPKPKQLPSINLSQQVEAKEAG